jgi:hypothetical protein
MSPAYTASAESAEGEELGDMDRADRAIELDDADFFVAVQSAAENAADSDAAEIIAVIEVHHLR